MITLFKNTRYIMNYSECIVSTFSFRACAFDNNFSNIWPDLICLEGPDQFPSKVDARVVDIFYPDRPNI